MNIIIRDIPKGHNCRGCKHLYPAIVAESKDRWCKIFNRTIVLNRPKTEFLKDKECRKARKQLIKLLTELANDIVG